MSDLEVAQTAYRAALVAYAEARANEETAKQLCEQRKEARQAAFEVITDAAEVLLKTARGDAPAVW